MGPTGPPGGGRHLGRVVALCPWAAESGFPRWGPSGGSFGTSAASWRHARARPRAVNPGGPRWGNLLGSHRQAGGAAEAALDGAVLRIGAELELALVLAAAFVLQRADERAGGRDEGLQGGGRAGAGRLDVQHLVRDDVLSAGDVDRVGGARARGRCHRHAGRRAGPASGRGDGRRTRTGLVL